MGATRSKMTKRDEKENDLGSSIGKPVIFVSGIPGAGNRTASETLSAITGYHTIFPGDLLRNYKNDEQSNDSRTSLFKTVFGKNKKISEKMLVNLIKDEMTKQENAKGFIICGFPRNISIASIFKKKIKIPEKVVALKVSDEIASIRLERKLSELGKPEKEIMKAESIVRSSIPRIKKVHKSFNEDTIVMVNSSTTNLTNWNRAIQNAVDVKAESNETVNLNLSNDLDTDSYISDQFTNSLHTLK